VHSIHLSGLDRVAPEVALRELAIESGEPLTSSAIVETERRLMGTGLFRSAVVGRSADGVGGGPENERAEGAVDLVIRLEEALPRSFRASVGYGSEDGPRGEVGLVWRNFLGDGRRLGLRAFASLLDLGIEGSLGEPYLLGPRTRGDLGVSALRQTRPGYEAFVTGASAIATFVPDRYGPWSFSVGPGYELSEIRDFSVEVGESLRGPRDATIVNTFGAIRYERVDDRLDPRDGFRAELANELGSRGFGSDLDYHLWSLDLRGYLGVGPLVLATRAAATTLDPISGGRADVPLTRRLYSGGTNSVRGFGFQKLGPEDASNDPVGGLSRLEVGTELRWRFWRRFSLVGFVDAGDVRSGTWKFRPGELRASAGPGLRFDTPVGPLRLDMGFLLNPPRDTDPWRIHLSVGHAF
jgi:outer membrane protein insertion porin family/translocation and assembly module TamA